MLHNANGMEVAISPYGAIVQRLTAPDRDGRYEDVVLGFDTLDEYFGKHPYFGAVLGRYANRIGHSRFAIDGVAYALTPGKDGHHLHGGAKGFDKMLWHVEPSATSRQSLRLLHTSEDGNEGYPGELSVQVDYRLSDRDELSIRYLATSNKTTHVNLSNHSYFNLGGCSTTNILDHVIELNADFFTPVNAALIPSGALCAVAGTPMDLRKACRIGDHIDDDDKQLEYGLGYDHNWVLTRTSDGLQLAARVNEPQSGRIMEVLTTEPGVQFYSGNHLDGSITGKAGRAYLSRSGFCLETQHFPDSPNQPGFPSTILRPGQIFTSETVYCFHSA